MKRFSCARLAFCLSFLSLFVAVVLTSSALASERATRIASHKDWAAYTFDDKGAKVCYVVSKPKKAEGNYKKRGDVFAFVTHRPEPTQRGVVNFLAGYDFKKDSSVMVMVDGTTFILFTRADRAWAPDQSTDLSLVEALKKGKTMVVKGTSARGTETTDTYSLMGISDALKEIDTACPAL